MNLFETAHLMAAIQSFNNRTVGEADVVAWQSVLADVPLADAEEAVRRHYAESTDWMMPAHVRRLVRDIERERAVEANPWAPGQYGVPKDQAMPVLESTTERLTVGDLSPRVVELLSQLRAELPDAGREKLFPRQAYWSREQHAYLRSRDGEPNPFYLPEALKRRAECKAAGMHAPGSHLPTCPNIGPWPEQSARVDPDPAAVDLAARIADCRTNGPHDEGVHITWCPDAPDPLKPEDFEPAQVGDSVCGHPRHPATPHFCTIGGVPVNHDPEPREVEHCPPSCGCKTQHAGVSVDMGPWPEAEEREAVGAHQHRASCHGPIGELLCGDA